MLQRILMDPRGLKVVMTADAVGGIWTYAVDLAASLSVRGVDVTLAVLGPGLDAAKRQAAMDANMALVELGHPPEWLAQGPDEVGRGGAALAALAREARADLLHLNHPALAAGQAFGCPVLAVCHSCVATWWSAVRGGTLPADLAWQADLVAAGYRTATLLAAPTHAFAEATREAYGLKQAPAVVFNGRSAFPLPRSSGAEPGGLTVGRLWDEGKDLATLDRAAAMTKAKIRAVGPVVGPNGAAVTLHHLDLVGSLATQEVRTLFAGRPVFMSAARYEPFGLSVLEAAQAGCALVLSDIASFRELWGEAALFVAAGDAAGFAAALDGLLRDPSRRARLGVAAERRAARFTLAASVQRLVDLYAAMMAGSVPNTGADTLAPETRPHPSVPLGGEAA